MIHGVCVDGGVLVKLGRRLVPHFTCLALCSWLSAACAPTLSSFTPAHVAKVKHIQAEIGTDVSIPTGLFDRVLDAGEALGSRAQGNELTIAEQRQLLEAAWAMILNPPSLITHVGVGVGVYQDCEVSGRLTSGGWRLGGRYQVLHAAEDGVDLSAGLGVSADRTEWSALGVFDVLQFEDYTRWSLELPLQVGKSGDWYRWWGGPRILLSSFGAGMEARLPATEPGGQETTFGIDFTGKSVHVGGQVGGAIGYKHLFIALEYTYVYLKSAARVSTTSDTVGSFDLGTTGAVSYPAIALLGEF